jgi:TetR/AcrR family transcriptional regulator, mexJK operon transcriptional repressor
VDPGDRRSRILRAAADLFMTHGYAGVSMDDVLAAVGGSKSTLYRYFTDKTDLFRSAVEMLIDGLSTPVRTFEPTSSDVTETLVELGRHFAALVLQPRAIALHRLVTAEAERVSGLGEVFFQHGPAAGDAVIARVLRSQIDAGVIAVRDVDMASAQLYQAMVGELQMRLLVNATVRPTPDEIERSISTAVDTFLNGALRRTSAPAGTR